MFKLVKFAVLLVILVLAAYMAFFVPVGRTTLWGHLRAIWSTQEAQDMRDDIKESIDTAKKDKESSTGDKDRSPKPVQDTLTDEDRKDLNNLLKDKSGE